MESYLTVFMPTRSVDSQLALKDSSYVRAYQPLAYDLLLLQNVHPAAQAIGTDDLTLAKEMYRAYISVYMPYQKGREWRTGGPDPMVDAAAWIPRLTRMAQDNVRRRAEEAASFRAKRIGAENQLPLFTRPAWPRQIENERHTQERTAPTLAEHRALTSIARPLPQAEQYSLSSPSVPGPPLRWAVGALLLPGAPQFRAARVQQPSQRAL